MVFGLTDEYPEANLRHYAFMLEGSGRTRSPQGARDQDRGPQGSPDKVALELGKDASLISRMGYMRPQKKWREKVAKKAGCLVTQVETEVVVPVGLTSDEREHAARTLRPKIQEYLDDFLVELEPTELEKRSLDMKAEGLDLADIDDGPRRHGPRQERRAPSATCTGAVPRRRRVFADFLKTGSTTTSSTATSRRRTTSRT